MLRPIMSVSQGLPLKSREMPGGSVAIEIAFPDGRVFSRIVHSNVHAFKIAAELQAWIKPPLREVVIHTRRRSRPFSLSRMKVAVID